MSRKTQTQTSKAFAMKPPIFSPPAGDEKRENGDGKQGANEGGGDADAARPLREDISRQKICGERKPQYYKRMRPAPYPRCPPTVRVVSSQCGRAAWS